MSAFRAADAGAIAVSPGPWPAQPHLPEDVSFESVLLRMEDGVRLAAFLYTPARNAPGPLACALKTDPYRNTPERAHDAVALARAGYAALILDVRGTGGSDGVPEDEYSHREHLDTVAVIDWLSRQPWSSGRVGMWGISYSAFNALQVAYDFHPPALHAIFVLAGTDDRYLDDIHMPGGCMLMVDSSWAFGMLSSNATPGAPGFIMDDEAALARWDAPPWLWHSLGQQRDGPHWRRGSLAPDYARLTTPSFFGTGYRDLYLDFMPRIMTRAPAVTMGVIGPWHHAMTWPGPAIDWDALKVRWFDHWLRGRDTGMLTEPRLTYYMPRWREQAFRFRGPVPGEWRTADAWPQSALAPSLTLYLNATSGNAGALGTAPGEPRVLTQTYRPERGSTKETLGATNGEGWYGLDWREEDAGGLAFDTPDLTAPLEIFGNARARVYVSATAPVAHWMVRVNDVAPDGTSYLVARGLLNGTHRNSHADPEPLVPGAVYALDIALPCAAHHFATGHRVRVVVDNAAFPVAWPAPGPMTTALHTGPDASFIQLPELGAGAGASHALPLLGDAVDPSDPRAYDGVDALEFRRDEHRRRTEARVTMGYPPTVNHIVCAVCHDDPATASVTLEQVVEHTPPGAPRAVHTRCAGGLRGTRDDFTLDITVTLTEDGRVVRERRWTGTFPRDLV